MRGPPDQAAGWGGWPPQPCPPAFPARIQSWAPPLALRALALSCLQAKHLKVSPVVQGTSQGLGPEPSRVIFFFIIKKQNLNQENKVIKFLLGAAGP